MLFRKAILIIHGFAGGTYDQEDLASYLELNNFFTCLYLVDKYVAITPPIL